jgi:hypothetical protein
MQIAPMKYPRKYFDAVTMHGHVYVVGGTDYLGPDNHKHGEYYDAGADKWLDLPAEMATGRDSCTVEAMRGSLYCVGGTEDQQYLNSVERYDPRDGKKWEEVCGLCMSDATPCAHVPESILAS